MNITHSWKLILFISLIHVAACTDSGPELGTWTEDGDQVLPPTETPYGCTVGESEDWGDGMTPSIAGSDDGYAVVYAEWFDQAGMVRMVAPDGEPTSPVQNLPVSQHDTWMQVAHGRNGYITSGADLGTYGGEDQRTVYMMDQHGSVTRSYGPLTGLWNWGLAGGETRDWMLSTAQYGYSESCPSGRYAYATAFGPAGTLAGSAPSLCLHEAGFGDTSFSLGFAASKDGFALGLQHRMDYGSSDDPYQTRMRLQVVVYDGAIYRKVDLGEAQGHVGLWISRIVATDAGYAVRWTKYAYDYTGSGDTQHDGYLTFLGPKGEFVRTVRLSRDIGDIAWNGREIGEVTYDDLEQTLFLSRYGADGVLIEEVPVAVTSMHYMSLPKIASGAGGFAIAWSDADYAVNERPHLRFAPVACE